MFGNTETPDPACGAGAQPALTNSGLLRSSAAKHHQALAWGLVFPNLGILGKRKKSNKEAANWNLGSVTKFHVDPCSLGKKVGAVSYKVESKPHVFE